MNELIRPKRATRLSWCLGIAVALASSSVLGEGTSSVADANSEMDESPEHARARIYREALSLVKEEKFSEAYVLFQSLWEVKRSFDVAMAMAHIESTRGEYVKAVEHFDYAKRTLPITGELAHGRVIAEGLAEARRHVGEIILQVTPSDAIVEVNGRDVEGAFFVIPGRYSLSVRKSGFIPVEESVSVGTSEIKTVEINLQPEDMAETVSPKVALVPRRRTWIPIVGGGATALFAGAGVLFNVSADAKLAQSEREVSQHDCVGEATSMRCRNAADQTASARTQKNVGTGMFVLAGVTAAGTLASWLLWTKEVPVSLSAGAQHLYVGFTYDY